MLTSITIPLLLTAALGYALRLGRRGQDALILHRPYNNLHSDATGARDFRLFE